MLTHGNPWQGVLGDAFISRLIFAAAMLLSLVSGYFAWWVLFTAIFLAVGFTIILWFIPIFLNLSRSFYAWIAFELLIHISVTIIAFALHHKSAGLIGSSGLLEPRFVDALYFSATTFTTLGYGDYQPIPEMRLATSIEAIAGMISVAIAVTVIWLWCEENMIPKEMAFFDGYRRRKKSMAILRVRVRTITGKERKLKDWAPVPQEGESYYYDKQSAEWLKVLPDTELPENAIVISAKFDFEE